MNVPPPTSFEDPALQSALRRAIPSPAAPPELRSRIEGLFAQEQARPKRFRIQFAGRSEGAFLDRVNGSSLVAMGLAACLLVGVTGMTLLLWHQTKPLPQGLELAMIARHDACCEHPDHHAPSVPQVNFERMGQYLRQELNHAVLAADLRKDGWSFRGAAICPVGSVKSAHLVFAREQRTLSVFSLPASAYPSASEGSHYKGEVQNHPVYVTVRDGAVFCMVGHCASGRLTAADLDRLMDEHRTEITTAASPGPRIDLAYVAREDLEPHE